MSAMSEVVRSYYDREVEREWGRLDRPYRRLELVTTLHLVSRYFPRHGHLADVGGGPGRYAVELLRHGYRVTLVDLSPRAVSFAEEKLAELGLQPEAVLCGDARNLAALPSAAFDGALLMGPLYHIVDEDGRARAISELRRILKPGAPAVVAFLNPWGILHAGRAAEGGVRGRPLRGSGGVRSGDARRAGGDGDHRSKGLGNVLRLAEETCELPQYRDATEHLHAVVRKPTQLG